MQTAAWWDRSFEVLPAARCTEAGAHRPLGRERAWQLPGGLACLDQGPNAWADHIITVDIHFPRPARERKAIQTAATLLPADSVRSAVLKGVNPDWSARPEGSCRQVVFTSETLRTKVTGLNPTWTGHPDQVTVFLYSGATPQWNGAEQAYDEARVDLATVMIGGANISTDGEVHC